MVGITRRGHSCKFVIHGWLIITNLLLGNKQFCGGTEIIESDVIGGGCDLNYRVVSHLNIFVVSIWISLNLAGILISTDLLFSNIICEYVYISFQTLYSG